MLCLALPCLICKIRPSQLCYLSSSVGRALSLESRVSWVRVPPEAADFLRKKSSVVELCCVSLCIFGRCLEVMYMYISVHPYTQFLVTLTWQPLHHNRSGNTSM